MEKILLFDLGGVLVDVTTVERTTVLLQGKKTREEVAAFWQRSKHLRMLECGECDAVQFAKDVVEALGLQMPIDAFLQAFATFTGTAYPGAQELLAELGEKYTLACLSDTSAPHWQTMCAQLQFDTIFKWRFQSYEIGKRKPDEAVYAHVLQTLQCDPTQIYYFDDRAPNVKAGAAVGMQAFQVEGVQMLKEKLLTLGLI